MQTRAIGALVLAVTVALPVFGFAQEPAPAPPRPPRGQGMGARGEGLGPGAEAPMGPREVQRLFEAYALVQAQDALKLTDEQYGQFTTRMKALQETRQRNQHARFQILRELNRLSSADSTADDTTIRDRIKALQDQDQKAAVELAKAYAAVDEVLDVKQQARFRVFEENMERRKFELLMRARQHRPGMDRPGTDRQPPPDAKPDATPAPQV
jgi:Spy/CpxP family protein refolding chaperone